MTNARATLPEGFRLTKVDSRYELSWVNWRVQRTRFPFWLVLAFFPFLVVFSLVVTLLVLGSGLVSSLWWVVPLCWIIALCTALGPAGLFFRETISLTPSELAYRSTVPLPTSFTLETREIKRVTLESRESHGGQADGGLSPVSCVLHVTSPERLLEMNRFGNFIFHAMQALLPFGRRWFRLPETATGWAPCPFWAPSVNAQVFALLRHLFSEMHWETPFETDGEGHALLKVCDLAVARKTPNNQMQATGVPPAPDL